MTEEELAKAMIADAKQIAAKQNKKFGTRIKKEPKVTKQAVTRGDGWRNDPLKASEIKDIIYFLQRGWCVSSTSMVCGVSRSSVEKVKKEMS